MARDQSPNPRVARNVGRTGGRPDDSLLDGEWRACRRPTVQARAEVSRPRLNLDGRRHDAFGYEADGRWYVGRCHRKGCSTFRVIVEPDTCESNAFCLGFAPDVFELDDDAPPVRVVRDTVGEDRRSAVEQAVMNCPKQAIRLEELEN